MTEETVYYTSSEVVGISIMYREHNHWEEHVVPRGQAVELQRRYRGGLGAVDSIDTCSAVYAHPETVAAITRNDDLRVDYYRQLNMQYHDSRDAVNAYADRMSLWGRLTHLGDPAPLQPVAIPRTVEVSIHSYGTYDQYFTESWYIAPPEYGIVPEYYKLNGHLAINLLDIVEMFIPEAGVESIYED